MVATDALLYMLRVGFLSNPLASSKPVQPSASRVYALLRAPRSILYIKLDILASSAGLLYCGSHGTRPDIARQQATDREYPVAYPESDSDVLWFQSRLFQILVRLCEYIEGLSWHELREGRRLDTSDRTIEWHTTSRRIRVQQSHCEMKLFAVSHSNHERFVASWISNQRIFLVSPLNARLAQIGLFTSTWLPECNLSTSSATMTSTSEDSTSSTFSAKMRIFGISLKPKYMVVSR